MQIRHAAYGLSPDVLAEMRAWIGDCVWGDLEPEEVDELADELVARGVDHHYAGGIAQFLADGAA